MFEFFQVVDATHDDPTFYPTMSAPDSPYPFEWESDDGNQPQVLTTKAVSVSQYSGRGWTQINRLKGLTFVIVVTQARVVVYCEKFEKGGGWRGFGAGGLAVALVANAVSHARAAARRRGKVLVGQVRYSWLSGVTVLIDNRGRVSALRLMVDAGSADEPRPLALDLALKDRDRPDAFASAIATIVAHQRLATDDADEGSRIELERIASGAERGPAYALPGSVRVGAAQPRSSAVSAAATTQSASRDLAGAGAPAPDPARSTDSAAGCSACGAPLVAGAQSCGRCGSVVSGPSPVRSAGSRVADVSNGSPDLAATTRRSVVVASSTLAGDLPWNAPQAAEVTQVNPGPTDAAAAPQVADTQLVADFRPSMPAGSGASSPSWTNDSSDPRGPIAAPSRPGLTPSARAASVPAEVWVVSAGLLGLAALVLYPVLKVGGPELSGLFSGSEFTRAFAALILEVLVVLAACGTGLAALAWSLTRGSRVAQVLTCVLAAIVSFGEVVGSQHRVNGSPSVGTGIAVSCVLITAVIVVALVGSQNARAFFGHDTRPAGVVVAATANVYLGGVAALDGVLLMVAGSLAKALVGYGIAFGAFGVLLIASNAGLRRGSPAARAATVIGYLGFIAVLVAFADKYDEVSTPSTLVPLGLVVAALLGLLLPARSQEYFSGGTRSTAPAGSSSSSIVAVVVVGAVVVAAAAYGFSNSPNSAQYTANDYTPDYSYSDSAEPAASSSGISQDQAQNSASTTFDALEGNGTADVCDGDDLPTLAVYDYRVGDVSPATTGSFTVSANVSLDDGSYETVSYVVTDDGSGSPCVEADSFQESPYTPGDPSSSDEPSAPSGSGGTSSTVPDDVPSVPSSDDPVPTDAPLPSTPAGSVLGYDSDDTPTSEDEIVEYQPSGLDSDQTDAVRTVIGFMVRINQQDFQSAWDLSTYSRRGSSYTANFRHGYLTSRFYQVEFGQPSTLADDLIVVPGRFVSKQDPAAQGYPDGVTSCSYWPQYMFTLAKIGGRWLLDTSGAYADRSELDPLKRSSGDGVRLNPVAQREDCS